MSLTSQLKDRNSPVSLFFKRHLRDDLTKLWLKPIKEDIKTWQMASPPPVGLLSHQSMLVGTAFDYVVRADTWGLSLEETVGCLGFRSGSLSLDEESWEMCLWTDLCNEWDKVIDLPASPDRDMKILRLLVILSWGESHFRSGEWPEAMKEALAKAPDLAQVLDRVPPVVCEDLLALLAVYRGDIRHRWEGVAVVSNPTFIGSSSVGGADADWITSSTLWDMKTTRDAGKKMGDNILQLLGYALLDWDNKYGIDTVGLYFPRFGRVITWPLADTLWQLSGETQSLASWRRRFKGDIAGEP